MMALVQELVPATFRQHFQQELVANLLDWNVSELEIKLENVSMYTSKLWPVIYFQGAFHKLRLQEVVQKCPFLSTFIP